MCQFNLYPDPCPVCGSHQTIVQVTDINKPIPGDLFPCGMVHDKVFKVVCLSCYSHGPEAESYTAAVKAARQTGSGVWTYLTKQVLPGDVKQVGQEDGRIKPSGNKAQAGKGHQLLNAVSKLAEGYTPSTGRMDENKHFVTDGKKDSKQYYSGNYDGLRIGKIVEDPSSKTGLKVFLDEEDNTWKARVEWLNVINPEKTGWVSDVPLTQLRQIYWKPNANFYQIQTPINRLILLTPFYKEPDETNDDERTYIP